MHAIIHEAFGAPSEVLQLRTIETPVAGAGDVLVQPRAVAVAKGDWLIARGLPWIARPSYGLRRPSQRVAGLEFAGVVEAIGVDVESLSAGDAVFGWAKGALAESVTVPASQLAALPKGISFEQAAAVPISGFTALQAVRGLGGMRPGARVLVIGASGGVGSFALQIAKAFGAEVTGVASTRNLALMHELGADHVIDYTSEGITDGGRCFDGIIDIAGNRPLRELRRALEDDGTLVIVGGSGGKATMGFGRTIRALLLSPFVRPNLKALISSPNREDLIALAELIEAGKLHPKVGATYPLAAAAEAIEHVGAGRSSGKTVVTI